MSMVDVVPERAVIYYLLCQSDDAPLVSAGARRHRALRSSARHSPPSARAERRGVSASARRRGAAAAAPASAREKQKRYKPSALGSRARAQLDLFAAQDRALAQVEVLGAREETGAMQRAQAEAASRRNIAAAEEDSLRDMEAQALAHAASIAAAAEARKNSALSSYRETGDLVEREIRSHAFASQQLDASSPSPTKAKARARTKSPARSPAHTAFRAEALIEPVVVRDADYSAAGDGGSDVEAIKNWSAQTLHQLKAEERLLDAQVSALKIRFAEKVAPLVERTKASAARGGSAEDAAEWAAQLQQMESQFQAQIADLYRRRSEIHARAQDAALAVHTHFVDLNSAEMKPGSRVAAAEEWVGSNTSRAAAEAAVVAAAEAKAAAEAAAEAEAAEMESAAAAVEAAAQAQAAAEAAAAAEEAQATVAAQHEALAVQRAEIAAQEKDETERAIAAEAASAAAEADAVAEAQVAAAAAAAAAEATAAAKAKAEAEAEAKAAAEAAAIAAAEAKAKARAKADAETKAAAEAEAEALAQAEAEAEARAAAEAKAEAKVVAQREALEAAAAAVAAQEKLDADAAIVAAAKSAAAVREAAAAAAALEVERQGEAAAAAAAAAAADREAAAAAAAAAEVEAVAAAAAAAAAQAMEAELATVAQAVASAAAAAAAAQAMEAELATVAQAAAAAAAQAAADVGAADTAAVNVVTAAEAEVGAESPQLTDAIDIVADAVVLVRKDKTARNETIAHEASTDGRVAVRPTSAAVESGVGEGGDALGECDYVEDAQADRPPSEVAAAAAGAAVSGEDAQLGGGADLLAECDYVENAATSEVPPSLVTPKRAREMPAKSEEMPEETLSAPSSASLSGLPPINIGSTTRRSLGRVSLSGRDVMDEADVSSDDIYNSFERSSPGHFDGEDEYQESPLKDRVPVFEGASFLFSFCFSSTSPPSSALHVSPSPPPPCVRASAASDWKPQIRAYIAELIRFAQAEDGGNLLREAHARRTKGDQVRHLDQRTFCALMK